MKRTFKKILCTLLVVVVCLTCAPLSGFVGLELPEFSVSEWFASKASAASEGYYKYTITDGEATIKDVDTSISGDITIPATLGGYSVTTIGSYAFDWCYSLTSITIPNSVTSIGDHAFSNCTGLTSLIIPDSVTSIGDYAFSNCMRLTSLIIPDSVTSIPEETFRGCGLTSFIIPDSVTSIGAGAFGDCRSLISLTLPDSVRAIDYGAFADCTILESVYISDISAWCNIDFVDSSSNPLCPGVDLYLNGEKLTDLIIPNDITEIKDSVFQGCKSLENITLPDSVTSIGQYAFCYCENLTCITIPDSVTSIGDDAFMYCKSLADVYYCGTEEQWNEISINTDNDCLIDATIHFNCCKVNSDRKHSYTSEIITASTHLTEGVEVFTCDCGYTYTEVITKLTEHTYEQVVTVPTCAAQGFTTYFCECGDSYKDKFVNALGHNVGEFIVVKEASCTAKGEKRADCSRCDYFNIKKIDLKQHIDENGDENCDACELYLPSLDCLCVCHAKTIGAFVYKLFTILDEIFGTRLLEKVFHVSEYCTCGLKH